MAPNSSDSQNKGAPARKRDATLPEFVGPKEFGRLLLLKAIARGGMGEVYLAAMGDIEGAERPCVVKIIRRDHADDASFLARFMDEARIQAQMQHPGVAQVLEAAIGPEGKPYVVVEYVAGRDLAEIRQRASQLKLQITWHDAAAIAASIAEALLHVHERTDPAGRPLDVAHRDLSPQNIMVGYGGEIKLIDFGTARGENRRCQTINGVVFAKPGYVAPEVAANIPGAAPADLYALGVVLWELCAARRFLQGDHKEHMAAVARGERNPPPLGSWLPVPPELDTIVARLTAPRIADRYESAREAHDDLLRLLNQAPGLANGERSVRARIGHLMQRLYPSEPSRSRAEFARLVAEARQQKGPSVAWPHSPTPPSGVQRVRELLSGTRYRIAREIATGESSVVYEAEHIDLGRKVALKVLNQKESAELEALFRNEARIVARLQHENLVQVHDFGVASDGRPYYAMEYLEGRTLAAVLAERGPLPWAEALDLVIPVCRALEAAHVLGVVHRDIKPANLFLTDAGVIKLLDFGITQVGGAPANAPSEDAEPLTVVGTPEYMAPEQVGNVGVDGRADIYALGVVLYEALTGTLPHTGASTVTLLDSKTREKVLPPSKRARERLPKYLDRVVLAALAPHPKDRYQSIADMKLDLTWIRGSVERARVRRRRAVLAGSALTAAALTSLLVLRPEGSAFESLALYLTATPRAHESAPAPLDPPAAERESEPAEQSTLASSAAPNEEASNAAAGAEAPAPSDAPAPFAAAHPTPGEQTEAAPGEQPAAPSAAEARIAAPSDAPHTAAPSDAPHTAAPSDAPHTAAPSDAARPDDAADEPARARADAQRDAVEHDDTRRRGVESNDAERKPAAAPARDARADGAAAPSLTPKAETRAPAAPARSPESKPAEAAPEQSAPKPLRARPAPRPPRKPEALKRALARAESLIEDKQNLRALEAYRKLSQEHPDDPDVLAGLSKVAGLTKWWGEALKAAERWVAVDASPSARLHLALTLRRVGRVEESLATLQKLVAESRDGREVREARELLRRYGGDRVAMQP